MNDNKKIAYNSIIVFIKLCVVSIIGLVSFRLVLNALGASNYGLYNVVAGIVTLLNILTTAMGSTTYRYITFEIGKKEAGEPNKFFNASLAIHASFALAILVVGTIVGIWYINNYLNVDPSKLPDARFVFIFSIITAALSTIAAPYGGLLVAYEKFSVAAIIEISTQVLKLAFIVLFLTNDTFNSNLRRYALIMCGINLFTCISYIIYDLVYYRDIIKIRIYKYSSIIKEMVSFAFWTTLGASANIFKSQGSAIIINLFFGTLINAAYGVAVQVESYVMMFARSLNSAAVPQITKNFSGGNQQRSIKLTAYISKYTFILMGIVAFPLIVDMDFILGIWLKNTPAGANVFCKLMLLTGLITCLGEGIPAMINATGKIRDYQIVINLTLLLGLPIGYLLYSLGYNCYAISYVYCIIMGILSLLKLYMLHRVVDFHVRDFFKISYLRIFAISLPLVLYYFLYNSENFTFWEHILGLIVTVVFYFAVVFVLGLDKQERRMLLSFVGKFNR